MRTMLTMPNIVYIIISDIAQTGYIRLTAFWNFSKLLFVLHILAVTKFQLRWCAPFQLLWTLFKSPFLPLRSLCKVDLLCFQTSEIAISFGRFWLWGNFDSDDADHANYAKHNLHYHFQHSVIKLCKRDLRRFEPFWKCCLFCTFWVSPNFYSGDAHYANYGERCSNHHFRYCANCVNKIYSVFKSFEIAVCFDTFWLLRNFYSGDTHHANYGKQSLDHHFRYCAQCIWDLQCIQTFRNCCLFCTFWLLQNF